MRTKLIFLFIFFFALSIMSAVASELTVTKATVGCKNREDKDKLTGFSVDGDTEAFKKFAMAHILVGDCVLMNEGDVAFLEDTAIFSGLVCIRPKGETDCFWSEIERSK